MAEEVKVIIFALAEEEYGVEVDLVKKRLKECSR